MELRFYNILQTSSVKNSQLVIEVAKTTGDEHVRLRTNFLTQIASGLHTVDLFGVDDWLLVGLSQLEGVDYHILPDIIDLKVALPGRNAEILLTFKLDHIWHEPRVDEATVIA